MAASADRAPLLGGDPAARAAAQAAEAAEQEIARQRAEEATAATARLAAAQAAAAQAAAAAAAQARQAQPQPAADAGGDYEALGDGDEPAPPAPDADSDLDAKAAPATGAAADAKAAPLTGAAADAPAPAPVQPAAAAAGAPAADAKAAPVADAAVDAKAAPAPAAVAAVALEVADAGADADAAAAAARAAAVAARAPHRYVSGNQKCANGMWYAFQSAVQVMNYGIGAVSAVAVSNYFMPAQSEDNAETPEWQIFLASSVVAAYAVGASFGGRMMAIRASRDNSILASLSTTEKYGHWAPVVGATALGIGLSAVASFVYPGIVGWGLAGYIAENQGTPAQVAAVSMATQVATVVLAWLGLEALTRKVFNKGISPVGQVEHQEHVTGLQYTGQQVLAYFGAMNYALLARQMFLLSMTTGALVASPWFMPVAFVAAYTLNTVSQHFSSYVKPVDAIVPDLQAANPPLGRDEHNPSPTQIAKHTGVNVASWAVMAAVAAGVTLIAQAADMLDINTGITSAENESQNGLNLFGFLAMLSVANIAKAAMTFAWHKKVANANGAAAAAAGMFAPAGREAAAALARPLLDVAPAAASDVAAPEPIALGPIGGAAKPAPAAADAAAPAPVPAAADAAPKQPVQVIALPAVDVRDPAPAADDAAGRRSPSMGRRA